ncbi:MAG: TerC/Alx family metal homeostasis membrane protein [Arcanobacterium sp.]|nr:TerC/Alx family metal homeostasis membrane protein [Arcanobacterium sp.]
MSKSGVVASVQASMAAGAPANSGNMHVYPWEWVVLAVVVVGLILFDLFGHVRKAHEPTIREATMWTAIYMSLALIFAVLTFIRHGATFATEFLAGYITEYSLSLDNIFVFIMIIAAFKIPRIYQQKVLMYGIIIALVLRFIFIMVGAALVQRFVWVFFIFGLWMLYTAVKQVLDAVAEVRTDGGEAEAEEEYRPNAVTRLVNKVFPVTPEFVGDKLVLKRERKLWLTPLAVCIVSIGTIDLMFALDSIPAIFGLTHEPFLVFGSNAFALLGLRQLFFLVDGLLERLVYLNFGLAAILGFIGVKLLLHAFHGYGLLHMIPEPTIIFSVSFIIVAIVLTVVASLIGSQRRKNDLHE